MLQYIVEPELVQAAVSADLDISLSVTFINKLQVKNFYAKSGKLLSTTILTIKHIVISVTCVKKHEDKGSYCVRICD